MVFSARYGGFWTQTPLDPRHGLGYIVHIIGATA
jgi:hypothetical protein